MPWFKVDDTLALHPKVVRAGNAAMGLWVRAGSWAAQQLTDGVIPKEMISVLGGRQSDARRLVAAGLWTEIDGAFTFHQWSNDGRQPSRIEVEAKRAAAAERQRKARDAARLRHETAENGNAVTHLSQRDSQRDSHSDRGVSHAPPDPTRPDPTRKYREEPSSATLRAADTTRPDIDDLCTHLADRIEQNGSKRPTVTKAWHTAARLMLDTDGRNPADIHRAIDWCQDDDFWRPNIMSMPKLRAKYDQLRLAAGRKPRDRTSDILRGEYAWAQQAEADAATHLPAIGGAS